MHWLIWMTVAPLVYSLVSAAPSSEGLIPRPEGGQYANVIPAKEENNTVANTTSEKSKTSSQEIVTEKQAHENKSSSESNFSTQKASKKEDASETTVKEPQQSEEKAPEKREDDPESTQKETHHAEENMPEKREDAPETTEKETQPAEEEAPEKRVDAPETTEKATRPAEEEAPEKRVDAPETTEKVTRPATKKTPEKRQDAEPTVVQTESETISQPQTPEQSLSQTSAGPQETVSETPSATVSPTTKRPKPSKPKPKPQRATTLKPLAAESPVSPVVTVRPTSATIKPAKPSSTQRYPCRCADGTCSCCTGIVLENFNVPLRSRACANITYEPDDFAFNFRLAYNNIVLYNRRMSAKNPRPACIPINRYFGIKMCAKLSNIYMSGRNMHACLDFEGFFDDETAFKYSFNCFRIGTQGVAIVRPEDGGGLPPPPDEEEPIDEDYDDSARAWKSIGAESWDGEVQSIPTFNITSQNQIF